MVSRAAHQIVHHLCPEAEQTFGLEIVDPEGETVADATSALRQCVQGLQTLGFFGGRKVVWLRGAAFFGNGRTMPSRDVKDTLESLASILRKGLPNGTHLVIDAPKIDKRSSFYKVCKDVGSTFEFEMPTQIYKLDEQAKARARQFLKAEGLRVDEAVLDEIVSRAGTNTRQLNVEVEKLSVFLVDRREVTLQDVRTIVSVSRESAGWDLADAVGHRDLPRALQMTRQLAFQGTDAVPMVMGLEGRFRDLLVLRHCIDQGLARLQSMGNFTMMKWAEGPELEAALSGMGRQDPRVLNPYRAGVLGQQAKKYTRSELLRAHQLCLEVHQELVTASLPGSMPIELLVLRILGAPLPARP